MVTLAQAFTLAGFDMDGCRLFCVRKIANQKQNSMLPRIRWAIMRGDSWDFLSELGQCDFMQFGCSTELITLTKSFAAQLGVPLECFIFDDPKCVDVSNEDAVKYLEYLPSRILDAIAPEPLGNPEELEVALA
jgi:hypothetical protein